MRDSTVGKIAIRRFQPKTFRFGIDVLLDQSPGWLRDARVGLVCHPASVDRQLVHSADRLHEFVRNRLVALFGPQHGARGEKQDNMIESDDYRDTRLNIPVYSLYGTVREPTDRMLRGIDVLFIDLQDVGTRVYTFVSTMVACMRAAARNRCKLVVLDRPNPIGGTQLEGNVLDPRFRSFVGELCVPMRHGMTMGELAAWANAELKLNCSFDVIPMDGWQRHLYWSDTGMQWVAPSPNMPTPDTAIVYPGTVMFEATNVSEGRGTTQPFELIGAPFIDPDRLVSYARRFRLPGALLRRIYFEPTFHKWAGQCCGGVQIHVLDRDRFQPYRTALVLMHAIARLWPKDFKFRDPPYEYEAKRKPIDIITGGSRVRSLAVKAATGSMSDLLESGGFGRARRPFLLYD